MRMNDQQVRFNIPKVMGFADEPIEVLSMISIVDLLAHESNQAIQAEQFEDLKEELVEALD